MNEIANLLLNGATGQEFSATEWQTRIAPITRSFLEEIRDAFKNTVQSGTRPRVTFYEPKGARKKRQAFDYLRTPIPGWTRRDPSADVKLTVSIGFFTKDSQAMADQLWWGLYAYGSEHDRAAKVYLPDLRQFVAQRAANRRFNPVRCATTGGWGPLLVEPEGQMGAHDVAVANRQRLVQQIATDLANLYSLLS